MRTANYFIRKYREEAKDWRALATVATSDESRELRLHFANELEKDAETMEKMLIAKKVQELFPGAHLYMSDSSSHEIQGDTDESDA